MKKKRLFFIIGIIWIVLNFLLWLSCKSCDYDFIVSTYGINQYYISIFMWFIVGNVPAIILILIAIFSKEKNKKLKTK